MKQCHNCRKVLEDRAYDLFHNLYCETCCPLHNTRILFSETLKAREEAEKMVEAAFNVGCLSAAKLTENIYGIETDRPIQTGPVNLTEICPDCLRKNPTHTMCHHWSKKIQETNKRNKALCEASENVSLGDPNICNMLKQRGERYGPFSSHASITQELKGVMSSHEKWTVLMPYQMEALEMIAHKIGRILNGDPNYDDSWKDIAGYAQLVVDIIHGKNT